MQQARRAQFRRRQPEPLGIFLPWTYCPLGNLILQAIFSRASRNLHVLGAFIGDRRKHLAPHKQQRMRAHYPGKMGAWWNPMLIQPSLSYRYCLSYKLASVVVVPSFSLYCGRKFQACRPQEDVRNQAG